MCTSPQELQGCGSFQQDMASREALHLVERQPPGLALTESEVPASIQETWLMDTILTSLLVVYSLCLCSTDKAHCRWKFPSCLVLQPLSPNEIHKDLY